MPFQEIITNDEDPEEIFELLDLIGEGSFGKVYLVIKIYIIFSVMC